MSDIIDFIEKLGADARLRTASAQELEAALKRAGLETTLWTSVLEMNQKELESLVGARSNVCSLVYSPDQEEEEEEEEAEDDGEDDDEEVKVKERKVKP